MPGSSISSVDLRHWPGTAGMSPSMCFTKWTGSTTSGDVGWHNSLQKVYTPCRCQSMVHVAKFTAVSAHCFFNLIREQTQTMVYRMILNKWLFDFTQA